MVVRAIQNILSKASSVTTSFHKNFAYPKNIRSENDTIYRTDSKRV